MASSSSRSPVPTFSGQRFAEWSIKMKDHLTSKGLWHVVENGYEKPDQQTTRLNAKQMVEFKEYKDNDTEAFFLIHKSLAPSICFQILNAKTAKELWDGLHQIFQMNDASRASGKLPSIGSTRRSSRVENSQTKGKKKNHPNASSVGGSSTRPTTRSTRKTKPMQGTNGGPSSPPVRRRNSTNLEEYMPDSGEKLQFDVVLPKTAVEPYCVLQFPVRVASLLPSKNIKAVVRCTSGETYEIQYYGERRQKSFGSGWRQLVAIEFLLEGDKLRFEVEKCRSNELEFRLHIWRHDVPPELQERSKKKQYDHTPIIMIGDSDDDNGDGENEDKNDEIGDEIVLDTDIDDDDDDEDYDDDDPDYDEEEEE